jgi:signal transduction histidine kinase
MKHLISFLIFFFCQVSVHAGDARYRIETAYRHEEAQMLDLQAAQSLEFKPYQGDLRLGFVTGETWIRVQILADSSAVGADAQTASEGPLVLRVGPYYLDEVLFYAQHKGQWHQQQGGDRHTKNRQNCPDDLYCFLMDASAQFPSTVYLKVQTDSVRRVQIAVMPAQAVMAAAIARVRQITASLTLAGALLVLSLAFLMLERSIILHAYFWSQLTVVLSIVASSGLLAQWLPFLPAPVVNDLSNLVQVIRVAMTIFLGWAALKSCSPVPAYEKAVVLMFVVCGLNAVLALTGHADWALMSNSSVMWANTLLQLWGVFSGRNVPPKLRIILIIGWTLLMLLTTLGNYAAWGLMDSFEQLLIFQSIADWRLNGVPIGVVVFWFVATEKSNRKIQKLKELQELQLEAAQSKAHQEKLQERRDLIDMLTHELKTPLSTIKFALASLKRTAQSQGESIERIQHIDASVNRMDAMIEHVALSNKIERHDANDTAEIIFAHELMSEVMQEYRSTERFELRIQDGAFFLADPHFLKLIVENLVSNAIKYASDGKIKISIDNEVSAMTCFRISNRVAQESLPDENRLFERYYRHPNFQNRPGMGIGLSLVHSAAAKMGATIGYQLTDQEVVFEVRLPF